MLFSPSLRFLVLFLFIFGLMDEGFSQFLVIFFLAAILSILYRYLYDSYVSPGGDFARTIHIELHVFDEKIYIYTHMVPALTKWQNNFIWHP